MFALFQNTRKHKKYRSNHFSSVIFLHEFGLGEHHNFEQSMLLTDVTKSRLVTICCICVTKLLKNVIVRLYENKC